MKTPFRLGYCCQNLSIPSKFRTTTVSWLNRNPDFAQKKIREIVQNNIAELSKIIHWNIGRNIFVYRLTSDFIPVADHPDYHFIWQELRHDETLWQKIKELVLRYTSLGGRIGTHPAQFTVLSSERPEVVNQSIAHLNYHDELLTCLGLPPNNYFGINIHVSNGTKHEVALNNTLRSLDRLSDSVRRRLTFETEENGCWDWQNLLQLPQPIVLDFHHHRINNRGDNWEEAFAACASTWGGSRQLTHYSEGREHPLDTKHSDFIEKTPCFPADIELECKKKDLAVLKLHETATL